MNNYSKSRHVTIDKDNRRFKLNNVVVPGKKKSRILTKTALAAMTGGLSLLIPSGSKKNIDWISFDDLVSYELIQNDDVVVKGGTGKAIIGGTVVTLLTNSILGAAGAISGGITGKRTSSKKINSLAVRITLNNFDLPCCFVYFVEKPIKSDSKEYRIATENTQQLLSILDLISHNKDDMYQDVSIIG